MVLPSCAVRAKGYRVEVFTAIGDQLAGFVSSKAEGIRIVLFGQPPGFAQSGCLVAKERRKRRLCAKSGIEVALALHGALRDLIQMPTHPCYLERDLAIMHLLVTGLAKCQQVSERILAAVLP